jgi:hypothetical protein
VWISASYVATGSYKSLCEGPNESVVAYRMGAPGGGFLLGTWNPAGGLSWAETTPGLPADIVEGMANGAVTSCAGNRSRMYAALEDSKNHEWLAVLRSDNGGQSWYLPYKDPARTALKAMGSQADDNLCIAAHPTNADIVLLAGRRDGVLGSFHGATDWDLGKWPEFPGNFHGDSRCLAFDPNDPDSNTVFAGGDGGFFVSHDLAVSWDSSCNTVLPTLVFDGIDTPPTSTHSLTASPAYPGVLAGGLVDNGEVYLAADGEPWRQLSDGDGSRAVFITPDVLLHAGNEDTVGLKWAQWNGKSFNPSVNSRPPSYPDGTAFLPILGRVTYPDYRDPGDGALLLAMGGETNGDVYGIFDNGAATDPASDRFSWKKLTTAADYVTGLGSLTGRSILIGTVHAHLYQFDPATGSLIELLLPTGLGDHPVRWIKVAEKSQAFCLVDNNVLRTTNMVSWVKASTIANTTLEVLEVDRALDPVGLFVAGSGGAWLSRDFGDTWEATMGLPRTPHANHLEVVDWGLAGRAIHLGTWNWSVWRASLT